MSGTSARESYRSSKRTRPSDSQPSRMTPPVLFRLPSVPMPGHDSAAHASNVNSAAMAMPMAAAAALPVGATSASSAPMTTAPSAPAQSAAATISAEKASGQRLLNILIVVLLLAALAVITWISINRSPAASMANNKVGNDAALDTLGDLKVPDVTNGTAVNASSAKPKESGLKLDEIKPSSPSDLSMIDLPDAVSGPGQPKLEASSDAESLLTGLDTSGTDSALASSGASTSTSSTPTAQIQLRTPVPMGSSNITSLVDAQKPAADMGNASLGSSTTVRAETVSTPTQSNKVFPANTDPTLNTSSTPSSTSSTGNNPSGDSPSLWDGAKRTSPEGLQLSGKPTAGSPQSQLTISSPLSAELNMTAARPSAASNVATAPVADSSSMLGATVGGGVPGTYNLASASPADAKKIPPEVDNLQRARPDLNPVMLAQVATTLAAKSAVSNSASVPPNNKPINSYGATMATNANTAGLNGQNLYTTNNVNPSPAKPTGPVNSYALQNVPSGITGNGPGSYLPPTTAMPGAAGQTGGTAAQLASGPNTPPAMMASYTLAPRGTQATYGQPAPGQPVNPAYNPGYAQPTTQQVPNQQPANQALVCLNQVLSRVFDNRFISSQGINPKAMLNPKAILSHRAILNPKVMLSHRVMLKQPMASQTPLMAHLLDQAMPIRPTQLHRQAHHQRTCRV